MQLPYVLRSLGQRLFRRLRRPIRSGVNRGFRWSVVSAGRGYGSGRFGADRLEVLAAITREGDCFWDVGAHKGFVTLAASRMVGPTGSVVAVEPAATNLWFLRRHVEWNGLGSVKVVPAALSARSGEARFGGRGDSLAYKLGRGDERVPVMTVGDVIARFGVRNPSVMKIDAEEEEASILTGAGEWLTPDLAILISVHGLRLREQCSSILRGRGFHLLESADMAQASARPDHPWGGDYDMLALGSDRRVDRARLAALPWFTREAV